jgi:hypothetical protein
MSRKKGTTTAAASGGTPKRRASEAKGKALAAPIEPETEAGADERDVQATRSSSESKRLEDVIAPVAIALLDAHPELPAKDAVLAGFGDYYRACLERRAGPRVPPPAPEVSDEPRDGSQPVGASAPLDDELEEAHPTSTFSFDDEQAPPTPAPGQSDLFAVLAGEAEHAGAGGGRAFAFSSETESIIVSDESPDADAQTAGTVIVPTESLFGDGETAAADDATTALGAFDDAPAEDATSMMAAFELPEDAPAAAPSDATVVVQAMTDEPEGEAETESRGAKKSKKTSRKRKT